LTKSQAGSIQEERASSARLSARSPSSSQLSDLHRTRILAAAARLLDERGYAATTVAQVIERARVSRSRFYELFAGCDACVVALLDELVATVDRELAERLRATDAWDERVRQAVWVILSCLERQPLLARACVVHSVRGGTEVLDRREEIIATLVAAVDQGRLLAGADPGLSPMTAEGVVGAATRLTYARLAADTDAPVLRDLLGELTGLILLPYVGAERTRVAQQRPSPELLSDGLAQAALEANQEVTDPLKGITMRLTHRTALALEAVAENPGASNKVVADYAGISDQGQASKLLARLERLGLIDNQASGATKWELNAWTLTSTGGKLVHLLGARVGTSGAALTQPRPILQAERGMA
jgi:AcrR family transcriptional regulator